MLHRLKVAVIALAAVLMASDSRSQERSFSYQMGYEDGFLAGHASTCSKTETLPQFIRAHLERNGICP